MSSPGSLLRSALGKFVRVWEPWLLWFAHSIERRFGRVPAPPAVTAKAVCAVDLVTGAQILAKNAWLATPPASLTKLATAIVFARASEGRWHERVEVRAQDLCSGSTMGLAAGDVITRQDVLYGMILPSGNDAAMVAARLVGPHWRKGINALASEFGMVRTRFLTPDGRDARWQFSTARDLASLAAAAFAVPRIRLAAATSHHEVRVGGPNQRTLTLTSTVQMLGEPHVVAGKTGSTPGARGCLALLVEKAGKEAVVVLLGATVAFDALGKVVEVSDRRYDDARGIIRSL
ncbi:MAG TPA: serine hydrolase [Steroidobacteraceae bacterium]|nr:serine hydrolase [Steroidobacteraceae bacterium]